jgi:hypothetical protein
MQNCNTVRKRCLTYLSELRRMGIQDTIPLANAKKLFSRILDLWDRYTLKAYFGTTPTIKTQHIRQKTHYQSGTLSYKDIELTHEVKHTEGYLERMGLVSIMRGQDQWYMKVHNAVLVPQLYKIAPQSIENISLSPLQEQIPAGKEREKTSHEVVSLNIETIENTQTNNNLLGERDKTGSVGREGDTLPTGAS